MNDQFLVISDKTQQDNILKTIYSRLNLQGKVLHILDFLNTTPHEDTMFILNMVDLTHLDISQTYVDLLKKLSKNGVKILNSFNPLWLNSVLLKSNIAYKKFEFFANFSEFTQKFPLFLRTKKSVLLSSNIRKQNSYQIDFLEKNQSVKCTYLKNNSQTIFGSIYDLLKFFEKQFVDNFGILCREKSIHERFKIFFSHDKISHIVTNNTIHEDMLNLKWRPFIEHCLDDLDELEKLCNANFPLIWSLEYDKTQNGFSINHIDSFCFESISTHYARLIVENIKP